jgi:hypothetical protein
MPEDWRPPFHTFDSKEKPQTPRVFSLDGANFREMIAPTIRRVLLSLRFYLMGLLYPHRENSTRCREHRDILTQGEEKQKIVSEQCDGKYRKEEM